MNKSWDCYITPLTNGFPLYSDGRTSCPRGFYCPYTTPADAKSTPVFCPASPECSFQRLKGKQCTSGAQGKYEPLVCQPGFYCTTPLTMTECPSGYYCPTGTVEPVKCDFISYCPEGSLKQTSFVGVLAFVIIDLLVLAAFVARKVYRTKRSGEPLSSLLPVFMQKAILKQSEKSLTKVCLPVEVKARSGNSQLLVDAFKKGLNGHSLSANFKFDNMSLKLPTGKSILKGVTGEIRSSRMTAIMGPSGAGKTTFMNVLCGKVSRTSGQLWVSGKEAEMSQFKKLIGYVPQEDIMLRELTVRENVLHSARVRLPASWSSKEVDKYVDDILEALNLSHVSHCRVGDETNRGISGGQRKRVNIAIELAAVPICLFLDEPTSGLDSTAALEVAHILEQIAELGLTVVSVIHQPRIEIFERFHDVLMFVPGGETAYFGPTSEVQQYFEGLGFVFDNRMNPADALMDILSGKGKNNQQEWTPNDLVRLWEKKNVDASSTETLDAKDSVKVNDSAADGENFHEVVGILTKERGAPFLKQIWYCHNRSISQQFELYPGFVIEVFVGFLAGFLIGLAAMNQSELFIGIFIEPLSPLSSAPLGYVVPLQAFLMGTSIALAAGPAGVKTFGEERIVYWREAAAGHSKLAYYLGKTWATIYRILISSLHFAAMYHVLARPIILFHEQYILVMLAFFGVYGMCSVISMRVARENAALLAVIMTLFASVLCGFGPTLKDAANWHIDWLFDLSYNRWLAEAQYSFSISIYGNVYRFDDEALYFGYTLNRTTFDILMAFVIGVVWRILGYLLMVFTNRNKQQ